MTILALICLCSLAWTVVPTSAHADSVQEGSVSSLERGRSLLSERRLWPAEQAAREAVASEPGSAAAHHLLGQILDRRGRTEEALAAYERARALDPTLFGIDRDLGVARFELGDRLGALAPLERALAAEPDDHVVRVRLGLCELEAGRPEAAAAHFEQAADDPVLGQIALYNLGLARLRSGRIAAARDAFGRAVARDPESVTGASATARLAELEVAEPEGSPGEDRRWRLGLAAGLAYDDNLVVDALDVDSGRDDGAGRFDLATGYRAPVTHFADIDVGYDFSQTLYFQTSDLDLQSHGLHATTSGSIGPVDPSLGYVYSLNTLGEERFLDFHEARASLGWAVSGSWYLQPTLAYRIKAFPRSRNADRDAQQVSAGVLQLVALGGWDRYLTLGLELERENAAGHRFDYWGPSATLALRSVLPLPGLSEDATMDVRYRFRWRNYSGTTPSIGEERDERIHDVRLRLDFPLAYGLSLRGQYRFERSDSNFPATDYSSNRVEMLIRYAL